MSDPVRVRLVGVPFFGANETVLGADSLAELRTVPSSVTVPFIVLGHSEPGDGGGGTFHWIAGSEEDDDDGIVVKPAHVGSGEPGRYVREIAGDLNARWWGYVDNAAAEEQNAKLQRALDATSARKTALRVPAGQYLLGQVKPASDTDWYGDGDATEFFRDPALALTSQLIVNKNVDLETPARLDRNIRIRRMKFNGSLCTWPRWKETSAGVTVADPEADYAWPDGVLVSGLTLPVITPVVSGGEVVDYVIEDGGAGFGGHPTHPYAAESVSLKIEGGGGYGAGASAVIEGGTITGITPLARGRGYTSAPTVTVMGGFANPTILIDASVNRRNPAFSQTGICIAMQKVDGFTVEDCTFVDYASMVVADQGCRDGLVQNNRWLRTGKDDGPFPAVWVQSFGNPAAPAAFYQDTENCRVIHNSARDLERLFALFAPTKGGVISFNEVVGAKESGIFIPTNANRNGGRILAFGNRIKGVTVSDIVAAAFEINAPAKNIYIIGNDIEDCEGGAMTGSGCRNVFFYDNQVKNCGHATGLLPFGPFSERVLFAVNTEARAGDPKSFPVFALGYAAGLAAKNFRLRGNQVDEDRPEPPFFVIGHVRSGDTPPNPLCTHHYVHENTLNIPPEMAFVDDSFTGVFEPNGFLCWNNPGSGWTGFLARDDKHANLIIDRVAGSGNSFLKHQLSPDSVFGMLAQLGLKDDLVLCLDAGDANSYTSGQTWTDASSTGNDYYRGATSGAEASDPTFHGTPGAETANEYFSVDGGDWFTPTAAHAFASTWHQNNAEFTLIMVVRLGASGVTRRLFSTANTTSGTGVMLHITTELNVAELAIFNAGATVASFAVSSVIGASEFVFIAFAVKEGGNFGETFGMVGDFVDEFDGTYDTPAGGAADGAPVFFAMANGSAPMPSGSWDAVGLAFDRALTQGEVARVRNALSLRFPSI